MKKILLAIGLVIALANRAGATVWTMPSGQAAGPTGYGNVYQQGIHNSGGQDVAGSIKITAIGTPSAPTLSTNGTAGSTSIVYACIGFDFNGNQTVPSSTATIATANATLSTTNSVNITCGGQRGALGYLIAKVDTSHILGYCYTKSNTACTVVDDGTVATTFTYTPQTVDQTANISGATISGGGGAPFTIGWDGDLGTLTNAAVKSMVAPCTGHFTSLSCVATLTGTCTTPPTVNTDNVTASTTGTATVLTTTVGTPVVAAQTLVFTSGNTIGLAQTATPGTCTVPRFACQATATCP